MSYAVVETGGKQYKVSEGSTLRVEKLAADVGERVTLDRVLVLAKDGDVKVGAPAVEGARVVGKVIGQGRAKKVVVFKYKPKKRYRVKSGHRQPYTQLQVEAIEGWTEG